MKHWTLVTGASEGLGREFAREAVKDGRNVVLTARSADKLATLKAELEGKGAKVEVILADLSDIKQVEKMWAKATKTRKIDVLVNNAGLGRNGTFGDGDADGWARELATINVNVTAYTYLMKQAIPHMDAHDGGRIINVASTAGFMPGPNMAVYHASKAYALHLSEAAASEMTTDRVTVTAVCPGATKTNFFNDADMLSSNVLKLGSLPTAASVAELGWLQARIGKRIVVPGVMNNMFTLLAKFSPRVVTAAITKRVLSKS